MVAFLFVVVCGCLAAALTKNTTSTSDIRLVGGKRPSEGRAEVFFWGQWWSICVVWRADNYVGALTCRLLGYNSTEVVRPFPTPFYGKNNRSILYAGVYCPKDSTLINHCKYQDHEQLSSCAEALSNDIGLDCAPPYVDSPQIRLNGSRLLAGRIEIKITDEFWETVCSRETDRIPFGISAATVVCRMLGFSDSQPAVRPRAIYGEGEGPILLSGVSCHGNESSILQCRKEGLGMATAFCNHSQDVGVDCAPPLVNRTGIRLVGGGRPSAGRVELQIDPDFWETVCARDGFDTSAAHVVCRMLGISDNQPVVRPRADYGEGEGPILLSGVSCQGNESSILQCRNEGLGMATAFCNHSQDVGVDCEPPLVNRTRIRLVGGGRLSAGRVELQIDPHFWETVCGRDGFNTSAALVVCRMLGISDDSGRQPGVKRRAYYGEGGGPILLTGVSCVGNESSILQCAHNGLGQDAPLPCGHSQDVGVDCLPPFGPNSSSITGPEVVTMDGPDRQQVNLSCTAANFRYYVSFNWSLPCDAVTSFSNSSTCSLFVTRSNNNMNVICKAFNAEDNKLRAIATYRFNVVLLGTPSTSILPAAIAGTLAAVLTTVLIVIGGRRYWKSRTRMRYARCQRERETQYYSQLLQDVLGGHGYETPATDEDYHSIDDLHIGSENEPRTQFCKRQHRLSCHGKLKPRSSHVPLPPIPLAEGDLQTAARPQITRRWSLPDDYLHPAVCRQQKDDDNDTASYQSAPFVYINPSSAVIDSSSSKSEPFLYISPPCKPGNDYVPVVTASDRRRHSLSEDNRNPDVILTEWKRDLPSDYVHPAKLSDKRRLSLPSDYLHPVVAPAEMCLPAVSDYVPRVISMANRSDSLPSDYLNPIPSFAVREGANADTLVDKK